VSDGAHGETERVYETRDINILIEPTMANAEQPSPSTT